MRVSFVLSLCLFVCFTTLVSAQFTTNNFWCEEASFGTYSLRKWNLQIPGDGTFNITAAAGNINGQWVASGNFLNNQTYAAAGVISYALGKAQLWALTPPYAPNYITTCSLIVADMDTIFFTWDPLPAASWNGGTSRMVLCG
eukprot:Phypoly_transcript_22180.p1 GENE.Phypoly_transcript_22180~~Phypoly_transcript_22180.p1  ORF type:complete len:142 (+),score=19.56 Phypoly_transcript_22180:178-603(+)